MKRPPNKSYLFYKDDCQGADYNSGAVRLTIEAMDNHPDTIGLLKEIGTRVEGLFYKEFNRNIEPGVRGEVQYNEIDPK